MGCGRRACNAVRRARTTGGEDAEPALHHHKSLTRFVNANRRLLHTFAFITGYVSLGRVRHVGDD